MRCACTCAFFHGTASVVVAAWIPLVFCFMGGRVILRALSTELFATSHRGAAAGVFTVMEALEAVAGLLFVHFYGVHDADDIADVVSAMRRHLGLHLDAARATMMTMRTTVDLDPATLERAKGLALKERRTLSAVVSDALAAYLGSQRPGAKSPRFELLVRGRPHARFPTPAEVSAIEDAEDMAALEVPRVRHRAAP